MEQIAFQPRFLWTERHGHLHFTRILGNGDVLRVNLFAFFSERQLEFASRPRSAAEHHLEPRF